MKTVKIISALIILIVASIFVQYENEYIGITTYQYENSEISDEFDGFRIVQLSDLHNAVFGKGNEQLIKKVQECQPDIIVITGDMVDNDRTNIEVAWDLAEELVKICPVYYVNGNHEQWIGAAKYNELLTGLSERGIVDMNNTTRKIERGSSFIMLAGLDDYYLSCDIREFLKLSDDEVPIVLLAHEPQYIRNYSVAGADLVLSGHAHGGQFRIPWCGGLYAPDQGFFPGYTEGIHMMKDTSVVISRGLGNSVIPLRLFNRPEVVVVELSSK